MAPGEADPAAGQPLAQLREIATPRGLPPRGVWCAFGAWLRLPGGVVAQGLPRLRLLRAPGGLARGLSRQVAGWLALGLVAAAAEFQLLRLLVEAAGLPPWLAAPLAAEALILAKFALADRWIFGHPRPGLGRALRYHGACAGALLVYLVVFTLLVGPLALAYLLAFVAGTAAAFAWSLLSNFLWVWHVPVRLLDRPE